MATWICTKGVENCNGGSCIVHGNSLVDAPTRCIYEPDEVEWLLFNHNKPYKQTDNIQENGK